MANSNLEELRELVARKQAEVERLRNLDGIPASKFLEVHRSWANLYTALKYHEQQEEIFEAYKRSRE